MGSGGDFTESEQAALVSVTEAGVAALEAEIRASKVQQASRVLEDQALQDALNRSMSEEENLPSDAVPREQIFAEVAEELRLRTETNMTLAVIDQAGQVRIANGIAQPLLGELVANDAYRQAPADNDSMFSVLLGGDLNVAYVSPPDAKGRRLVAVDPLKIGGGSLLRRVLGSQNPAGLLRGGELVGEIIGDQPLGPQLETLARAHREDAPDSGSSKVFVVGEGLDARLGALGRVPGPAGKGKNGVMLGVLSRKTAAAGQRDLAKALRNASDRVGQLNWPLLLGLLAVTAALALYLPHLEALGPMRRLAAEFEGVTKGTQHQIFHDRYAGPTGDVARAAADAHEALRRAYLAELEIEGEAEPEDDGLTAPRPRPRTGRQRKLTRSHQPVEKRSKSKMHRVVPPTESTPTAEEPAAAAPSPAPAPAFESPPTPQPAAVLASTPTRPTPAPPAITPTPPPAPTPPPPAKPPTPAPGALIPGMPPPGATAPLPTTADPKESHYREVFEEFIQVKEACGEPTNGFSYEKFAAKLRKNRKDLLEKRPGIEDVNFTVYVKDGKAALKAKVVKA